MNKKLLFIYDGKMNGVGCDMTTAEQLAGLSEAGMEVDFISRGRVDLPGIHSRRLFPNPAKLLSSLPAKYYYGATRRWLARCGVRRLAAEKYDGVIAWSQSAHALFTAARARGIPCILNYGNLYTDYLGFPDVIRPWPAINDSVVREEVALATRILVPSEFCRETFVRCGIPGEKIFNVDRGFDLDTFVPGAPPEHPFRVLFCGRVCDRKGIREAVAAWTMAGLSGAELWVLGAVDKELESWVDGVTDPSITFLGFRRDVSKIMRSCHAQIMLSNNDGLAKPLIEGAACGLATIATPESSFAFADGVHGFLVKRHETGDISGKLRLLAEDRELCTRMGRAGRELAVRNFTWQAARAHFAARVAEHLQNPASGDDRQSSRSPLPCPP